jgi:hypothetical protein
MLIAVSLSLSLSLSLPREQSSSRRVAGNKHPPAGGRTRQRHGGEKLTRRALVGAKRIQARVPLQPSPPCSNALHACIFGSVRQLQRHARTRRERTCECTCFCKYAVSSLSLSLSLSLSVCLCLPVPGSPSLSLVPAERYGAPIDHYEQFRETGRPVSKQRPVITSPICRTLVDEATAGYDVKGDIAADLH